MKKLLITFLALIILIPTSFAEEECSIKSDTAPILNEYIENNIAVIKEINNQVGKIDKNKSTNSFKKTFSGIRESFVRVYNNIFGFDGYFSSFRYFVLFPISNEIPYEVKRDYKLIEKERENINKNLKNYIYNGKDGVIISNICSKVNGNCDIANEIKVSDLLQILLENNNNILNLYRNTVVGEELIEYPYFLLVQNNFVLEIEKYYSQNAYSTCSLEEGGFFDRISNSIDQVSNLHGLAKNGIQKWKDAWALLIGTDSDLGKNQEVEKKLLLNELGKQGIYGDSQTNVLSALDKYNEEGFTKNSNFAYNTYNNTKNKLLERLRDLKDDKISDFIEKEKGKGSLAIESILTAQYNSLDTNQIKENIDKLYLELLSFEAPSEQNASTLIGRIIKSHIDIVDAIDVLSQSCEKAVQVCKEQDPSKGDCGKCN